MIGSVCPELFEQREAEVFEFVNDRLLQRRAPRGEAAARAASRCTLLKTQGLKALVTSCLCAETPAGAAPRPAAAERARAVVRMLLRALSSNGHLPSAKPLHSPEAALSFIASLTAVCTRSPLGIRSTVSASQLVPQLSRLAPSKTPLLTPPSRQQRQRGGQRPRPPEGCARSDRPREPPRRRGDA